MKIEFPSKYKVVSYIPSHLMACIHVPREHLQDVVNELRAQAWVRVVDVGIDGISLLVNWSAAYEYPEGEPLAALHKICQSVMEPEPKLDDVWHEALDEIEHKK